MMESHSKYRTNTIWFLQGWFIMFEKLKAINTN